MNQQIKGYYHDTLFDSKRRLIRESGWNSNLVVNKCNLLMAMLMKRHADFEGILYCAVGEGEEEWDTSRPIPLLPDTKLTKEVYRQPISVDQINYIDENGQPSDTPTNHLDISVEFNGEDIVSNGTQPIREFGLFGGDATDDADSGYLINRVTHDRYDLTPLLTLNRKIHLTFKGGAISQEELTNFGAALPIYNIDGVGKKFTSALNGAGVKSLDDLVKIDPLKSIGNIPLVKLREFRAKARLVMGFKATLAPFVPLADYSISSILLQDSEKLSEIIGSPDINVEIVAHFQEELAILQVALDDETLKKH